MKICLAQLNYTIGDFEQNTLKISDAIQEAKKSGADLVLFSELAVCGYMPDDLLDYDWFVEKCESSLEAVAQSCQGIAAVVGGVMRNPGKGRSLQNVACFMQNGKISHVICKTLLPTYDIFNEARYFEPADHTEIIEYKNVKLGIAICEDFWDIYNDFEYKESPVQRLKNAGAELILHPSASPFHLGKAAVRDQVFAGNISRFSLPVCYVNQVGVHTDLIFDGDSQALNAAGDTIAELPYFQEKMVYVEYADGDLKGNKIEPFFPEYISTLHDAIVFGIREYFSKMGFKTAILGSSGGIDSAVVQALATEALGAENVFPVLMPSEFSSEGSITDAELLSGNLGNKTNIISIADTYHSLVQSLSESFQDKPFDVTEENLQARIRGILLMALSNKFGHILLNTSNKSEMAVGYSTLYGDMCGGLSPLGDVYKMKVYALANYINRNGEIIPQQIIDKAPSAELRPGQKDSDSLPEYSLLDEILNLFIEERRGRDEIKSLGYEPAVVDRVIQLVNRNEYKRYQSPPILRVSGKAFGSGRRIPLVAKYG
ncbi:MAG: NAD+ synthase [Bacteroidetes bacterium]|nr:NAD+ synthase [Bacteroidota bacterium]